jgi:hypothetical protein
MAVVIVGMVPPRQGVRIVPQRGAAILWPNVELDNVYEKHPRTRHAVGKHHFLRHLYIKMIILPRQARDKQRENSKQSGVSLGG